MQGPFKGKVYIETIKDWKGANFDPCGIPSFFFQ